MLGLQKMETGKKTGSLGSFNKGWLNVQVPENLPIFLRM